MTAQVNRRFWVVVCFCALALAMSGQQEKRITLYAPQGTFSISVREQNGQPYVPVLAILRDVGAASGQTSGKKFVIRFAGGSACEFEAGKAKAKIRGKNIDLSGPAVLDSGDVLIPARVLAPALSRLLGLPAVFREAAGRLLLGTQPIDFHAELHTNPSRLVLHFSRPVSPAIASEPGRLAMNFSRDPVVAPDATQTFPDKLITSATFAERDGTALLAIAGSGPLMATFSDEGKTITVAAPPQAAPPAQPTATLATPTAEPKAPASAPPTTTAPRPRFLVVIDPAHGGQDIGAVLAAELNEKDLTLIYARRLRTALEKAGVQTLLLRDADTAMGDDDRAAAANTAHAAAFISVHVGSVGRGVRTYTARLVPPNSSPGALVPWDFAQVSFLDESRDLSASIATALGNASVEHAEVPAQMALLDHVTAAAVVVEFLPGHDGIASLTSPDYQQRVCAAVATGIAASRRVLEARK